MATRTIPVSGNGTGTLTFQNPGPDVLDIESVLALIDTSGAGDTLPTLTVTSPAGNDVAAVPQGSPVTGGGQGRATWALRLAEDGGGSAPAMPLVTTDGVTTISPTDELVIGAGLALGGAGTTATIAERALPFVMVEEDTLTVPAGGVLVVDFKAGAHSVAYTNDVPAVGGYKTNEGGAFGNTSVWVGDTFQGAVTDARSAFSVRPARGGVYLFDVRANFKCFDVGNLTVTVTLGSTALLGAFAKVVTPFTSGQNVSVSCVTPEILLTDFGSPNTDVSVVLSNSSGTASEPSATNVRAAAYRLSPA